MLNKCAPETALGAAGPLPRIRLFGEGCLSGASSRAIMIRGSGPGTRRAAHGRKWFWALLPKQKCLVARGRNPAYKIKKSGKLPFIKLPKAWVSPWWQRLPMKNMTFRNWCEIWETGYIRQSIGYPLALFPFPYSCSISPSFCWPFLLIPKECSSACLPVFGRGWALQWIRYGTLKSKAEKIFNGAKRISWFPIINPCTTFLFFFAFSAHLNGWQKNHYSKSPSLDGICL